MSYKDFVFKSIWHVRLEMVLYALEHGIQPAARRFRTTRKTVRKWVRRYKEEGLKGLRDRPRRPKRVPHKTPREIEEKVVALRNKFPFMGSKRLRQLDPSLPSHKAIDRILRERGLTRRRRAKKRERKRLLRRVKSMNLSPFQLVQVDVKELADIPNYRLFLKLNPKAPRFQYTLRDVYTGTAFVCLARERNVYNSTFFILLIGAHLRSLGIRLGVVQTDNGSEFKSASKKKGKSLFIQAVEHLGATWRPIPPGAKTYNSDVERFHGLIEEEFYDVASFSTETELLQKLSLYIFWFNAKRRNSYKESKTPFELLTERPSSDTPLSPQKLHLKPFILDDINLPLPKFPEDISGEELGGYHVGWLDSQRRIHSCPKPETPLPPGRPHPHLLPRAF